MNGNEITDYCSVGTCKPPFKVNYVLINAFQNLSLESATIFSAVLHQKHTLTYPEVKKNKSTGKEKDMFSHVLTHIHKLTWIEKHTHMQIYRLYTHKQSH